MSDNRDVKSSPLALTEVETESTFDEIPVM